MQRKILRLSAIGLLVFSIINWSCTKIDTTDIGQDLIPAVDNVHTFDTTLTINTTQGLFTDSTRMARSDNHVIGSITNDPVFGKTDANLFLELKPTFFPYYFGSLSTDTLNGYGAGVDSVVLCLSFRGFYGDTTLPQTFSVYQMDNNTSNFADSSYLLNYQPSATSTNLLAQATVDVRTLRNFTYLPGGDSVQNQIRIKLPSSFATALYGRDSTSSSSNNAFYNDSLFRTFYKGFEIRTNSAAGGNGLCYVNLTDASTRLEVYYRKRNAGVIDTTYASFPFNSASTYSVGLSYHANNVQRDRSASEYPNFQAANTLYIQSTPGTYAKLSIPGLSTFSNSIIHRAEIIVEQIASANPVDQKLLPSNYLYIDLIDSTVSGYSKPVYYDLSSVYLYNPDNTTAGLAIPTNGVDFGTFGGVIRTKLDYLGNTISWYDFNLTRYVQNMITKRTTNYDLKLYAPFELNYYGYVYPFNNSLAYGRVKVGSGTNPNYRLRMRIIYSKI